MLEKEFEMLNKIENMDVRALFDEHKRLKWRHAKLKTAHDKVMKEYTSYKEKYVIKIKKMQDLVKQQ